MEESGKFLFGMAAILITAFIAMYGLAKWSLDRQAESAINQLIEIAKIQECKDK
ncbi:hypothetical protein [Acinetobacter pittii]|uniref:hypothetical protein n=1 Tax=Acinetobacter pittii TaxID=48296 RepID=UPI00295518E3|nr:hypothetical protein [Acinetobacter pittii]MDV7706701.1 hypothetical protein [Acinetobacter pittii]MDV7759749.1 hypothetical protein [Acinetobacter pittii]